jgi:anti-sigma-K factor RskA
MAHNERHEDLVAAQALGMPLGDERAELERHLAEGCDRCESLLADFRGAATALASEAPGVEPPPELRAKILGALGPARVAPRPAPAGPSAWRALAAAAALLLVAVGLDDARLRREREDLRSRTAELGERLRSAESALSERVLRARVLESEDVQMMILGGKGPQPEARARVFWSERARRGVIVASNLAPLPTDRQYELWVFQKGKPINAGVFDVDAQGRALFESTDFPEPQAQNFAVTVEPRGGVPAPTGPIVLVGSPSA